MAFKKFKLLKKKEIEIKKQLPKSKEIKVPQTHDNKSIIDIITILLHTKQNTGLRKLLDLPASIISKNLYMFTAKVLELCLEENFSNDLFFKVLKKFMSDTNVVYIYNLLYKYLEVCIYSNRNYIRFCKLCIELCPLIIFNNKEKLEGIIDDIELKKIVQNVNIKKTKHTIKNTFIYVNGVFIEIK